MKPRIERLLDALSEALMGLAELPLEPGTPEHTEAVLRRRYNAELEGDWRKIY
ncbi:hypothetical protein [Actinoplanes regularis]|uniref:Uncharacterized protein n=1 Tax=Actinoplanes regularis TaxID=52697 RepID=A0A238YXW6_9ACTN|nr:hypothetical protein [Actinoplanes regularis]GIE85626.1 hypothetical protein Are01nite_21060 [Actinoplanes regularis]SNR75601.1 hypothetical protein SAMN06264365_105247 [Actinoplanes regularis]